MAFSYPLLVCDIGGTHARAALYANADDCAPRLLRGRTADFARFEDFLDHGGGAPRSMIAAVAGTVLDGAVSMTNAGWRVDARALVKHCALEACLLLNDFEAQALALPAQGAQHLRVLQEGRALAGGARVVCGPGTGFGAATLAFTPAGWMALPSEMGNSAFGARTAEEAQLFAALDFAGPPVVETFLSGDGLSRLDLAVRRLARQDGPLQTSADVVRLAQAGDAHALAAASWFWRLFARSAGDLAMIHVATGGVTLTGGMTRRLLPFLNEADFLADFTNKGARRALAQTIPVAIALEEDSVFEGLAALARRPQAFALDYATRLFGADFAR